MVYLPLIVGSPPNTNTCNRVGLTISFAGLIREKKWYGPGGMENARTKKEPMQSIPTFAETVALLMKVRRSTPKLDAYTKRLFGHL